MNFTTQPARINYRSIQDRTLDDQLAIVSQGRHNIYEQAIDELGQALMILQDRLDRLEGLGGSTSNLMSNQQLPDGHGED